MVVVSFSDLQSVRMFALVGARRDFKIDLWILKSRIYVVLW